MERRNNYLSQLKRAVEEIAKPEWQNIPLEGLTIRLEHLESRWRRFEEAHNGLLVGTTPEVINVLSEIFVEAGKYYFEAKEAIIIRGHELQPREQPPAGIDPNVFRVEFQVGDMMDHSATIGQFDGDFAQWLEFRDRFKAAVDTNSKIKDVHKLARLKASVKGAAAKVVGPWSSLEGNYKLTWDKLCSVYNNEYRIVMAIIRSMFKMPRMNRANN